MERHVMTVMCVISRALYTTRHCRCGYLLYFIHEAPQAAGSTIHLLRVATICCHLLRRLQGS